MQGDRATVFWAVGVRYAKYTLPLDWIERKYTCIYVYLRVFTCIYVQNQLKWWFLTILTLKYVKNTLKTC